MPDRYRYLLYGVALLGIALAGARAVNTRHVSGPNVAQHSGFYDFNHGLYYPTRSFASGVSPYGERFVEQQPVTTPIPPYTPSLFVLHLPVAAPALLPAQVAYFGVLVLCLYACARLTGVSAQAQWITPLVLTLLVWSRGGQSTLHMCYFTPELVLGSIVALHYAQRSPALAGLGVLLAASKLTCVLPLTVLMLCRGNRRAVAWGAALTAATAGAAVAWLLWQSTPAELLADFAVGQSYLEGLPDNYPWFTVSRIDFLALVCKWTGWDPSLAVQLAWMAPLLVPAALACDHLAGQGDAEGAATPAGAIIAVTVLVCIYHHHWDLMLLAPAIAGVLLASPRPLWDRYSRSQRWAIGLLLTAPSFNLLGTRPVLGLLGIAPGALNHKLLSSVNGVCLVVAWLLLLYGVVQAGRPTKRATRSTALT